MRLWKICRALWNPVRFALLRDISTSPRHALNVVQAADRSGRKKSVTSQYLKQLADAGLLAVERRGSYAICASDRLCRSPLARLQKALADFFAENPSGDKDKDALKPIKALSHHGRIAIVRKVAEREGGIPFGELAQSTGFPPATLFRQLGMLVDAGIVKSGKGPDGKHAYSLVPQPDGLRFALVSLACDNRLDQNSQSL